MVEKLKIKTIYDDFLLNVHLTDEQIRILNMMLNKDSTVKISMEIGVSERTVTAEIRKLKDLLLTMDPTKKEIVDSLTEDSRLIEDVGLASVSMIYLVIAIEEEFNVEFGNVGVEDFKTIGQTIDYIEELLE